MKITTIVMGVILFALATIVLYLIGMRKKINQDRNLLDMLLNNGAKRVVKYLKGQESVSAEGVGYIIEDLKAKEFHSKKTAIIKDGRAFQDQLIDFMLDRGYIVVWGKKEGQTWYCLPDKKEE